MKMNAQGEKKGVVLACFTVMVKSSITVCKWNGSDWIALYYDMTKRNNTIAEAALWTMAKARTIIGFICIHLVYCLCMLHRPKRTQKMKKD